MIKPTIYLASKSARRRELLDMIGLEHVTLDIDVDETVEPDTPPDKMVEELSKRKASAAFIEYGGIVIAADTIVYCDGMILGKPSDRSDAVRMLTRLSGNVHEVYTGMTVMSGSRTITMHEATKVYFREVSPIEIENYINADNPYDKAGAYGIQDRSGIFAERLEGDFYTVVGLPLCRLTQILSDDFGIIV